MALQGLQNYTFPLTLLGETTVNGDLNVKNIYVSGLITGVGISSDILGTDNVWVGTNDFQDTASYTGPNAPVNPTDMLTKKDIDDDETNYTPLPLDNTWTVAPVFSNANPPVLATAGASAPDNVLVGYNDMVTVAGTVITDITKNPTNTFTGINTFTNVAQATVSTPLATVPQRAATKDYVDRQLVGSAKSITYLVTTQGQSTFQDITGKSIDTAISMDYILFSGACLGQASGSVVCGTIGNGFSFSSSILFKIGNTTDPSKVYTDQLGQTLLPSSTTIIIVGQLSSLFLANAAGACNLNGTIVGGIVGNTLTPMNYHGGANGQVGANNILSYNGILGTTTSQGGMILTVHYI